MSTGDRNGTETSGPPQDEPASSRHALDRAVRELERHVARGGWDGPLRVFALIRTAEAIAADPSLREQLPPDLVATADADPSSITSVEQEGLPEGDSIEEVLGRITWPPSVHGAAVVVERFVVPPEAERDLPDDPDAALRLLLAHPERQDVRLAVGRAARRHVVVRRAQPGRRRGLLGGHRAGRRPGPGRGPARHPGLSRVRTTGRLGHDVQVGRASIADASWLPIASTASRAWSRVSTRTTRRPSGT